jgi:hypothetical protein
VSQLFFDLSTNIEIWLAIYKATKRAHTYRAGARGCVGLACDSAQGALRRGVEAGRGARRECAAWERSYGCGGSLGGGGVGVDWLVACLDQTRGWLVHVMDLRAHHPR